MQPSVNQGSYNTAIDNMARSNSGGTYRDFLQYITNNLQGTHGNEANAILAVTGNDGIVNPSFVGDPYKYTNSESGQVAGGYGPQGVQNINSIYFDAFSRAKNAQGDVLGTNSTQTAQNAQAAAQAAQNAQTKNFNRGFLNDQAQTLRDQLGRLDKSRDMGFGKIGTQYETELGLSNQDKERQMAQYGDSRISQEQGKERAFGEANKSANNAFRSLSQIIGRGAGTGSSAFRELLPDALNKGLNENRGGAIENYSQNMQGIKKAEDQYGLDFGRVLEDLLNQRKQQETNLDSGIEAQRQGIYGQQATIAGQLQENENPNASYDTIRASQNPYRDLINQSSDKIMQLDAFAPKFNRTQAVAQTPNINEYTTNRASVNAQNQGLDPSNAYANILRKRLQE